MATKIEDESSLEQFQSLLPLENTKKQPLCCRCHRRQRPAWYTIGIRTCCLVLLLIYSLGLYTLAANRAAFNEQDANVALPGPADEAIKYEVIFLIPDNIDNPYAGDPRPEHDQAWSDLLENIHIRFSKEEMEHFNKTSLELKDGGYMVQLGAYHELHCVKWIRKWIHRDHYWPFLEGLMFTERKIHIEHCLELMRLNAMCRGSQDITTFEWVGSRPKAVSTTQHKCVNWELFDAWNHERCVDLSDLSIFKERPEPQSWEIFNDSIRLGSQKGDTQGFKDLLAGKITDTNNHG